MAERQEPDPPRHCPAGGKVTYDSYLLIPKLLDCQKPVSKDENGKPLHVETLFILIHQVFELWFKQFLHDLGAVTEKLDSTKPSMADLQEVHIMMDRMVKILKLVSNQFEILETMPAQDFMNLRDHLQGGSGFQSLQFRLLENKIGVQDTDKTRKGMNLYEEQRAEFEGDSVKHSRWQWSKEKTLLQQIDKLLASLPGLKAFEEVYKQRARQRIEDAERQGLKENFPLILDEEEYERRREEGELRLSRQAFVGALMVFAHREEPFLQQLFPVLTAAMDLDSLLFRWRANHVMMVHRMIGAKIGTGSSTGYFYLRSTLSEDYRVFSDLSVMATCLMPESYKDKFPLPPSVRQQLRTWQEPTEP